MSTVFPLTVLRKSALLVYSVGYILSLLGLCLDPPPMVPKNPMLMVALAFEQGGILYEVLLPLPLLVVMLGINLELKEKDAWFSILSSTFV